MSYEHHTREARLALEAAQRVRGDDSRTAEHRIATAEMLATTAAAHAALAVADQLSGILTVLEDRAINVKTSPTIRGGL
jgi:hypothetical protein